VHARLSSGMAYAPSARTDPRRRSRSRRRRALRPSPVAKARLRRLPSAKPRPSAPKTACRSTASAHCSPISLRLHATP
jgi:hypothetical protein